MLRLEVIIAWVACLQCLIVAIPVSTAIGARHQRFEALRSLVDTTPPNEDLTADHPVSTDEVNRDLGTAHVLFSYPYNYPLISETTGFLLWKQNEWVCPEACEPGKDSLEDIHAELDEHVRNVEGRENEGKEDVISLYQGALRMSLAVYNIPNKNAKKDVGIPDTMWCSAERGMEKARQGEINIKLFPLYLFARKTLGPNAEVRIVRVKGGVSALFTKPGSGIVWLSFRGTKAKEDVMTDFKKAGVLTPFTNDGSDNGQVHNGFKSIYGGAGGFHKELPLAVKEAFEKAGRSGARRLVVCGHSMGGALAYLASADRELTDEVENGDEVERLFVTIASPQTGDARFRDTLYSTTLNGWTFVHNGDIVSNDLGKGLSFAKVKMGTIHVMEQNERAVAMFNNDVQHGMVMGPVIAHVLWSTRKEIYVFPIIGDKVFLRSPASLPSDAASLPSDAASLPSDAASLPSN